MTFRRRSMEIEGGRTLYLYAFETEDPHPDPPPGEDVEAPSADRD